MALSDVVSGGESDWGPGYYRLHPSRDRPFSSEPSQTDNRWRSNRYSDRDSERQGQENQRYDERRASPRDLPDDFYQNTRNRSRPSRQSRPWGEIPPEWRNEDLDQHPLMDRRPREEAPPRNWRRLPQYDDTPSHGPWPMPDDEAYNEFDTWDYPYVPSRDYRRREYYYPYSPYYADDRPLRGRRSRRRDPYYDYYYDGGNGWWEYP